MKNFVKSALLLCLIFFAASKIYAQVSIGVSIRIAPPPLPVYTQPACPYDGYIWTPGYWAYGPDGYYWVPGVWIAPPRPGILWTPGYWGFAGGIYGWHAGYWGPHIGFYGGVNYGYGYGGCGYSGGMWQGNSFHYNTAVTNVNTTIVHNTYVNNTVINNNTNVVNNRSSFNGEGGITARPTRVEEAATRDQHVTATSAQLSHEQTASHDRGQLAAVNNGRPATAAMNTVNDHRPNQQARISGNNGQATSSHQPARATLNPARQVTNGQHISTDNNRQANNKLVATRAPQQTSQQMQMHQQQRTPQQMQMHPQHMQQQQMQMRPPQRMQQPPQQQRMQQRVQERSQPRGNPHQNEGPREGRHR
ncbi:YXWGXW repeat-containing protein [Chitinophaga niastensis]|uniref:YXWGXW repeat-containing protein n=1 Tax=Chitinophaga niastensis TaxID=536980 RepID=A0A2P8HF05_CHINA|nr:YXWGXW repeat-containing protein [Chitinophaga niastensis]PSL44764.1 YXWGXW repeat-containing protein [Chitinophaga niastensis]